MEENQLSSLDVATLVQLSGEPGKVTKNSIAKLKSHIRKHPNHILPIYLDMYSRGDPNALKEIFKTKRLSAQDIDDFIMKKTKQRKSSNHPQQIRRLLNTMPADLSDAYRVLKLLRRVHVKRLHVKNAVVTTRPCAGLHATMYLGPRPPQKIPDRVMNLPKKRITRNVRINSRNGPRFYEPLTVCIKHDYVPPSFSLKFMTHAISKCKYARNVNPFKAPEGPPPTWKELMKSRKNRIFVHDTDGELVAAGSFSHYHGGKVLILEFLCSSSTCKGAGTAVIRALEAYGHKEGFRAIELLANGEAVPFYFKTGFQPLNDRPNASFEITKNNKIRYPRPRMMEMTKRINE